MITLVTGDRVTWHGNGKLSVEPRGSIRYLTYDNDGHHYVIPSDALPLLRAERLDRRLFDITALLEAGYDKRGALPLIVTGDDASMRAAGLTVTRTLPVIDGYAATATAKQLKEYWKGLVAASAGSGTSKIWLDGMRRPSLDVSVPQIGAPAAWSSGLDGTGVTVAVLDTGIDAAHPDLAGKIAAERNFAEEVEDGLDRVGHGTHVASTIAGSGVASGGKYKGVAPGATLLDGKVCFAGGCAESWIIAGMHWAAESGAQVVNMSLGGTDTPEVDPVEQAVNELTAQHGTLFVVAAGNSGVFGDYTVGSPASAEAALAVGAVDKSDQLARFSSRGPRVGDSGLKPEITGPGVDIVAARGKDGFLGEPGEHYMPLSGTSMATPHVAGAAAILTQKRPQWTAEQRKAALIGSAHPNPTDGPFAQGAGRVDVARAITTGVHASPAAIGFGVQPWPHGDDPVLSETVTYHNTGDSEITLQLALTDTVGGTFSLSADTVTVPAKGTASVILTADTRQGSALGPLGGRLVATADGVRVQTPFGVDREVEKFELQLVHTDRAGAAAESYLTVVVNLETGSDYLIHGPDGIGELRVPAGDYFVFSWIDHFAEGEWLNVSQLVWPKLAVSASQSIQLDARKAGPVFASVPDETVTPLLIDVSGRLEHENGSIGVGASAPDFSQIYTGHLGPKPVDGFTASIQAILARLDGGQIDPSLLYSLAWTQSGSMYDSFRAELGARDLVTIREHVARHASPLGAITRFPDIGGGWAASIPLELPGEHTYYVNADVKWIGAFSEMVISDEGRPENISRFELPMRQYRAGKTYHERFNQAVFGPTLPDSRWPTDWISRDGDLIAVFPPLLGDARGNAGFSRFSDARTALYRDGELIGEEAEPFAVFEVPAETERYRLESTIEREAPFRLSTRVDTVWGFSSSHVDGVKRLPVTTIGFGPRLDDSNTARAAAFMVIPVTVSQQPDSGAERLKTLGVDVSYDDGATWRKGKVITVLGYRFLLIHNPAEAGFVSLRAHAQDTGGNTVEQTIIRAYEVK